MSVNLCETQRTTSRGSRSARWFLKAFATAIVAAPALGTGPAPASASGWPGGSGPDAGTRVELRSGWAIQSSASVRASGAVVSRPAYSTRGWLRLSGPETLMAGLIENGRYPDIFYSDNLTKVPTEQFDVNWWYRKELLYQPRPGRHAFLVINGVNGTADVWLNGAKVADRRLVQGSYSQVELDVTGLLRAGRNAVALDVTKNDDEFNTDPTKAKSKNLTLNMVDWSPPSPDRYTGLQFAPELAQDGPISVRHARVVQRNAPDMSTSDLTLKAQLRNNTASPQTTDVVGSVVRQGTRVTCRARMTVPAGATRATTITPAECPDLHLVKPAIWWPYQLGEQPLYRFSLQASVHGVASDGFQHHFGIRTVTSTLTEVVPGKTLGASGWRKYAVNRVPLMIRGAGWSQDMFLRYSSRNIGDQLSYVKNLGLNTIRFEGNFPPDDMLDQMDRAGILAMTGLQCCDHWEDSSTTWDADVKANARNQATHLAHAFRTHPSVFTFLFGSDYPLDEEKASIYLPAFAAADWEVPEVGSAWYQTSPQLGPSGTKEGSYNYGPPSYWWSNGPETANNSYEPVMPFLYSGSAWGFETEASPGNTIPTQDSLDRFLTQDDQRKIWDPSTTHGPQSGEEIFHTCCYAPHYQLSRLGVYNTALFKRYGPWPDMASYQKLAQLGGYEVTRAQFEAYIGHTEDEANPTTGVIYWMLNKAWPSLQWSLYNYDLDQPGVYFGAKKANEPVHILYAYDDGSVKVVNFTGETRRHLAAKVDLIDIDGTVRSSDRAQLPSLPSQDLQTVLTPKPPDALSTTYFARLTLSRGGSVVSRNVYLLSKKPDEIDWESTHAAFQGWPSFEQDGYADLTGLQALGQANVDATARTRRVGDELETTVTITNVGRGRTPVVGARADVFAGDHQVLPIRWSDNQVTLWPGEAQTIMARYDAREARGRLRVRLTGMNLTEKVVAVD
jgi:exo-1,4-beta-D-glucosaminidase